jgi:hypothetical protein
MADALAHHSGRKTHLAASRGHVASGYNPCKYFKIASRHEQVPFNLIFNFKAIINCLIIQYRNYPGNGYKQWV